MKDSDKKKRKKKKSKDISERKASGASPGSWKRPNITKEKKTTSDNMDVEFAASQEDAFTRIMGDIPIAVASPEQVQLMVQEARMYLYSESTNADSRNENIDTPEKNSKIN